MPHDRDTIWDDIRGILGEVVSPEPPRNPGLTSPKKPDPPPTDRVDTYRVQELVKKIEVHATELHKAFDELQKSLASATRYIKDAPELRASLATVMKDFEGVKGMNLPEKVKNLNQVLHHLDAAAKNQHTKLPNAARR